RLLLSWSPTEREGLAPVAHPAVATAVVRRLVACAGSSQQARACAEAVCWGETRCQDRPHLAHPQTDGVRGAWEGVVTGNRRNAPWTRGALLEPAVFPRTERAGQGSPRPGGRADPAGQAGSAGAQPL